MDVSEVGRTCAASCFFQKRNSHDFADLESDPGTLNVSSYLNRSGKNTYVLVLVTSVQVGDDSMQVLYIELMTTKEIIFDTFTKNSKTLERVVRIQV